MSVPVEDLFSFRALRSVRPGFGRLLGAGGGDGDGYPQMIPARAKKPKHPLAPPEAPGYMEGLPDGRGQRRSRREGA